MRGWWSDFWSSKVHSQRKSWLRLWEKKDITCKFWSISCFDFPLVDLYYILHHCFVVLMVCRKTVHDSVCSYEQPGRVYTYAAEMLSATELECPLPPSPLSATSSSAVNTWNISVSNDGLTYSNHLQLTVYDSRCLDCQCAGQCQQKVRAYTARYFSVYLPVF